MLSDRGRPGSRISRSASQQRRWSPCWPTSCSRGCSRHCSRCAGVARTLPRRIGHT